MRSRLTPQQLDQLHEQVRERLPRITDSWNRRWGPGFEKLDFDIPHPDIVVKSADRYSVYVTIYYLIAGMGEGVAAHAEFIIDSGGDVFLDTLVGEPLDVE